jgi:hypothetical protein
MSRGKLSSKGWVALSRGRPVTNYPPGGEQTELRMFDAREPRSRRKKSGELAGEPSRARTREKGGVPFTQSERPNCTHRCVQVPGNPKIR